MRINVTEMSDSHNYLGKTHSIVCNNRQRIDGFLSVFYVRSRTERPKQRALLHQRGLDYFTAGCLSGCRYRHHVPEIRKVVGNVVDYRTHQRRSCHNGKALGNQLISAFASDCSLGSQSE